jgi:hypothetical protein
MQHPHHLVFRSFFQIFRSGFLDETRHSFFLPANDDYDGFHTTFFWGTEG